MPLIEQYDRKKNIRMNSKIFFCFFVFFVSPINADVFFNPSLLSSDTDNIADLSRFEKGDGQAPGIYRVEIYLNDEYKGTRDISFKKNLGASNVDDSGLTPCLTKDWLIKQSVNLTSAIQNKKIADEQCIEVPLVIENAYTNFDFNKQKLLISIPQAMIVNNSRGYIPPEEWQNGITAALFNYRFSGSHSNNGISGYNRNSQFLNLTSGVNLGAWRIRNEGSWHSASAKNKAKWNNISTYVQRIIIPLKSTLTLGDSFTDNDIFESIGFKGAKIASDDNMLPESQKGFAPIVRGIANTNAQVTIEQNGYVIYQTYVPPGAFEINDLYATSNSGNLIVNVKESNGVVNQFEVPYSTVPLLQREGKMKYSLVMGRFRSGSDQHDNPNFLQGTLLIGLKAGITFYQGFQAAKNYNAISVGLGKNLGNFGAFSVDVTHANSQLPDGSQNDGQSLRFLYAKSLNDIGTNIQLLGYRYSTKGFYTFAEAAYKEMSGYSLKTQDGVVDMEPTIANYYSLYYTKKGRLQANISQQLGDYGSVYLMGSYQTYWHTNDTEKLFQAGYNNSWEGVSYNVNFSLNKDLHLEKTDKRIAFSVSIPLSKWLSNGYEMGSISNKNTSYGTYSILYDDNNQAIQQAGISGTLLKDNNLNYSIQQGYSNKDNNTSGIISLDYRGGYGNLNTGYSYTKNWRQLNYGASGGVIVHENGVTLGQPLSDTSVLVKAPGASNVNIENITGVKTDWRGYAIVPYATTYRNNRIALNTNTMSENMDVEDAVVNVIPTKGAIVKADFITRIGNRAMITLIQKNGKPVPFGAIVNDSKGSSYGIVGDNGQVFMSGLSLNGSLSVAWGDGTSQNCTANYLIGEESSNIYNLKETCI
ncbi:fimbrial biogenesis usher protein [Providencia rettgeri]